MKGHIVVRKVGASDPEYQVRYGREILASFTTRRAAEAYLAASRRGFR